MTVLPGMNALKEIEGDLQILTCYKLQRITGFQNLEVGLCGPVNAARLRRHRSGYLLPARLTPLRCRMPLGPPLRPLCHVLMPRLLGTRWTSIPST